jgi:ATP-binding cassette, subfamily B (MDR/TAP), member 1
MGYALSLRMGKAAGLDRGSAENVELDSPAGIIVESLLNIRTVAALTLERRKFEEFRESLLQAEPDNNLQSAKIAITHGMAYLLHHWVDGILLFFAGWLLHEYPTEFTFVEMLNANFSLYFSLFGLGLALKEIANREEIKLSTSRVFYLLDRPSLSDPLSRKGQKLD